MKKIVSGFVVLFSLLLISKSAAIPNPWVNCADDISCASKVAGFNFPLRVENYSVRAMKGMIEIEFPIGRFIKKQVIVRKADSYEGKINEYGFGDISGVYNDYPVNKTVFIEKAVPFTLRGYKNKFIVANFAAENGYYSFYCKNGMKLGDITNLYNILEEAEAPRHNFSEIESYTLEQLADMRMVDDIVEPVYTQDCFPRTLAKKGVSKVCFERANLGEDSACSASEVKMIKDYYKKGQDKDPLNNGSENFCAD